MVFHSIQGFHTFSYWSIHKVVIIWSMVKVIYGNHYHSQCLHTTTESILWIYCKSIIEHIGRFISIGSDKKTLNPIFPGGGCVNYHTWRLTSNGVCFCCKTGEIIIMHIKVNTVFPLMLAGIMLILGLWVLPWVSTEGLANKLNFFNI